MAVSHFNVVASIARALLVDYTSKLFFGHNDNGVYDDRGRRVASVEQITSEATMCLALRDYRLSIDLWEGRRKVCL